MHIKTIKSACYPFPWTWSFIVYTFFLVLFHISNISSLEIYIKNTKMKAFALIEGNLKNIHIYLH